MVKSLAGKAVVPVALAVTGFVVVCCILLYSVFKSDITHTATIHATSLSSVVVKATRHAMLTSDRETLREMIENISGQKDVEHVRIFNKKGLIVFSSEMGELDRYVDKKTAGCVGCHAGPVPAASLGTMEQARLFVNEKGREVLAVTEPIYNEPECFNAACHVHSASQKILGTLDIGLSRKPLRDALNTMRDRMIVFTLFILLLSVGGVAALLRLSILTPIRIMTDYANDLARGKFNREIPVFEGEMEELARSLKNVAAVMDKKRNDIAGEEGSGSGTVPKRDNKPGNFDVNGRK